MAEETKDGVIRKLGRSDQAAGIGRLSMMATPVLLAIIGWFVVDLIDGQRKAVTDLDLRQANSEASLSGLAVRTSVLESIVSDATKNADRFEGRMSKMEDGLNALGREVSGLAAKIDTLIVQKRADVSPFGITPR